MSTRATYKIDGHTFYIHHDGYPEGAAVYFYKMITCSNNNGGFAEKFVRANEHAEFTISHETHSDTEFRYTLEKNGELRVLHRPIDSDNFGFFFSGSLSDFINRYHQQIENFSPVFDHWYGYDNNYLNVTTIKMFMEDINRRYKKAKHWMDRGATGNASSIFDEVWKKIAALNKILAKNMHLMTGAELDAVKEMQEGVLAEDEKFVAAYKFKSVEQWREKFRQ